MTDIRDIIRDEIGSMLRELRDAAKSLDGFGTGEIRSSGLQAIVSAVGRTISEIETGHDEYCGLFFGGDCTPKCEY